MTPKIGSWYRFIPNNWTIFNGINGRMGKLISPEGANFFKLYVPGSELRFYYAAQRSIRYCHD